MNWSVVKGDINDLESIWELKAAVNPGTDREQWIAEWKWQFFENPNGGGCYYLAKSDDKVVGYYGVFYIQLAFGGSSILGALSGGTMTHPEFRKQGIFTALALPTFEEIHSDGIEIVYGFPNAASHPGFIKYLQWNDMTPMRVYTFPIDWKKFVASKSKSFKNRIIISGLAGTGHRAVKVLNYRTSASRHRPADLKISLENQFSAGFEGVESANPQDMNYVRVVRSVEQLNWRYTNNPSESYDIAIAKSDDGSIGYFVARREERNSAINYAIGDLFSNTRWTCKELLDFSIKRAKELGCASVTCALTGGELYLKALTSASFLRLSRSGAVICGRDLRPAEVRKTDLTEEPWLVFRGASDTY